MKAADELHQPGRDLFVWQVYEPSVKAELTACAVAVEGELVLIDPVPLAADAMEELLAHGRPSVVVLTNGNHARGAEWYRERFGVRVAASAEAVAELGLTPDRLLADGDKVAEVLTVHFLPGAGPGEIALVGNTGTLHLGDAVIHLPSHGFALLPEKYCADRQEMTQSLRKLLRAEFSILTFAHGLPLVTRARERFAQLLV